MNKAQLKAVTAFTSRDEVRPVLASLYVEKEQSSTKVVATDGFTLVEAVFKTKSEETFSTLIPNAKLLKAVKIADKESIQFNKETIELDDVKIRFEPTDGNYPEYEKLIDRTAKVAETPTLDPKYISNVAALFKAFSLKPTIRIGGNNAPVYFEASDQEVTLTAIIMPLKK